MFGREMKDSELENIVGGVLTDEAWAWVNRNRAEIINRAGKLGFLADIALKAADADKTVYDVEKLKAAIKGYGVDVDNLN